MMEVWRDIEGYEGLYQVSNLGRVKSLERIIEKNTGVRQFHKEKILKQSLNTTGYPFVGLSKSGEKRRHIMTHRLVAAAFVSNPHNKKVVNHKNGIKHCSEASNLEWVTLKENSKHASVTGLWKNSGEDSTNAKLSQDDVNEIRKMYDEGNLFQKDLAKIYGVGTMTICRIVNNKRWVNKDIEEKDYRFKNAKLDFNKATEIRNLYAGGGYTQQELADKYGVSIGNVNRILSGKHWATV